jgi:hypothetical protein
MMRVHRLLLSLLMLTLLTMATVPWVAGAAAQQNNQCFAETNQCIEGRFLEYWRSQGLDLGEQGVSARESLALFGYPLTPEFTQTLEDGQRYTVQYFERARFELHPENQAPYDVLLGQFGRRILATVPNAPIAPVAPSTRQGYTHVRETGHNVAPDFSLFWSRNGGLATFGYPLSEEFEQQLEDGQVYTVQYFERARFERHTAREGQPYNVQLGQFGRAILASVPTAPDPSSDNLFATILGPAEAPALWAVRPCQGDAPFLCITDGQERVGAVTLYLSHLEALEAPPPGAPPASDASLADLLRQQGLTPGAIDPRNPEHASKIAAAMRAFVEQYHRTVERDRQASAPGLTYTRLATEPAQIGSIPGLRYGFALTDQAGTVRERYLNYAAFDGTLLYVLVAQYDGGTESAFRSDEELRRFEPYLTKLVAGLRLPLPVETTTIKEVVTQGTVPVFRAYAMGGRPVAVLSAGQTLRVTGQSPNQRWWRVACPNDLAGDCWVSAAADMTKPKMP